MKPQFLQSQVPVFVLNPSWAFKYVSQLSQNQNTLFLLSRLLRVYPQSGHLQLCFSGPRYMLGLRQTGQSVHSFTLVNMLAFQLTCLYVKPGNGLFVPQYGQWINALKACTSMGAEHDMQRTVTPSITSYPLIGLCDYYPFMSEEFAVLISFPLAE